MDSKLLIFSITIQIWGEHSFKNEIPLFRFYKNGAQNNVIKHISMADLLTWKCMIINSFYVTGLFLYSLKSSENLWFFLMFSGVQKETSGMKRINHLDKQ